MSIEVPHLPFEGGLPEVRDPNRRTRRQRRATPIQLPQRSFHQRFVRWAIAYLPRWMHDYSTKLAVALTMTTLGAWYGIEYFHSPEVPTDPPTQWTTVVMPER